MSATSAIDSIPHVDIDVFSDEYIADPVSFQDELREAGPVIYLSKYGIYAMARYADVMAALKDFDTYCNGRGGTIVDISTEAGWRKPSLLVENDPPQHSDLRKLMDRIVTLRSLNIREAAWMEKARSLVATVVARGRIDAVPELAEAYPMTVFPDLIGVSPEGREQMLIYSAALFNSLAPDTERFRKANEEAVPAVAWVTEACKRANLAPDGWGMQVFDAVDQGIITEDEAERLVRSFVSAGVDTTVNGIAGIIQAFASNPDQWQLLRNDPSLVKRAIEEGMRYCSPVRCLFRTTTRAVEVDGCVIPEGRKVLLLLGAANRDPRRWENGDSFDISRSCSGQVAFGFGIHQCLGQMVARRETELILKALVEQVAEIRLAGEPVQNFNNAVQGLVSLPVELVPA